MTSYPHDLTPLSSAGFNKRLLLPALFGDAIPSKRGRCFPNPCAYCGANGTPKGFSPFTANPAAKSATAVVSLLHPKGVSVMSNKLSALYWEAHGPQGIEVETFLEDVAKGLYGEFSREEIRTFLLNMETSILENIESKASEAPHFAALKDEIVQETVERFRRMRARFAP